MVVHSASRNRIIGPWPTDNKRPLGHTCITPFPRPRGLRERIFGTATSFQAVDRTQALAGYRWVRAFAWPRAFPIVQFPNDALIVAFVAGQAVGMLHGAGRFDAQAVSYLAMTIWAYEELAHGVNWFRHASVSSTSSRPAPT